MECAVWVDDELVWSGDEMDLFQGLDDGGGVFPVAKLDDDVSWIVKGSYTSSRRDIERYRELESILKLNAGPGLRCGRLLRKGDLAGGESVVFLEELIELRPTQFSELEKVLTVHPLAGSKTYSASIQAAVQGNGNVIWKEGSSGDDEEPFYRRLSRMIDRESFQRCAVAHLIFVKCTNLADILLKEHPGSAGRPVLQILLGDHKKCFWPAAINDFFWVRFSEIFSTVAQQPLCADLHRQLNHWASVAIPNDMPLRDVVERRVRLLSNQASSTDPSNLSIALLGDLCLSQHAPALLPAAELQNR